MYDYGGGVIEDYTLAVYLYRKADEQGHAKAHYNLGVMYESGRGIAKDDTQAVYWFRKAAEQGEAKK
jgi:TPR repeat protein